MKVRKVLGKARARTRTVRSDSKGKAHPPWSELGMVHFRVGGRTVIQGRSHSIYYTQVTNKQRTFFPSFSLRAMMRLLGPLSAEPVSLHPSEDIE